MTVKQQPTQEEIEYVLTRGVVQVEKDRSASDKGLDVPAEFRRIEATERRQELPLAARPLEKRFGCHAR